jgi:hypothetical protein
MDGQERRKAMNTVAEVFSAWKTVHDKLKELEKAYKNALTDHAAHAGPFPQALKVEIAELRIEADRLLHKAQHELLKIKTPRSSTGDSTWS